MWIRIRIKTVDFKLDGSRLSQRKAKEIIDALGRVPRIRMTSQNPIGVGGRGDAREFVGSSRPHVLEYVSDIANMQGYGTMEITSYHVLRMPWERIV